MASHDGLIKQAAKAFALGDYRHAHQLYSRAGDLLGIVIVRANLRLCERRMAQMQERGSERARLGTIDSLTEGERKKFGQPYSRVLRLSEAEELTRAHGAEIKKALQISASKGSVGALSFLEAKGLQSLPVCIFIEANGRLPDEQQWLARMNEYLSYHSQDPIELATGKDNLISRLRGTPKKIVSDGPKVSVLMPAFNSKKTLKLAATSILNQGWRNIELIIIDDASDDGTWHVCQAIAQSDNRVKVLRNAVNVGPYVSKNRALMFASGEWITGHDADDWAHPDRITSQIISAQAEQSPVAVGHMLRIRSNGEFSFLGRPTPFSPDGCKRLALISTIFDTKFLRGRLGGWDCVRFGADSELLARAEIALERPVTKTKKITMICLDEEHCLTNHPVFGLSRTSGLSGPRVEYKNAWKEWHAKLNPDEVYLPFPHLPRRYEVPSAGEIHPETLWSISRS